MSAGIYENDRLTGLERFWHGLNEVFTRLVLGDPKTDALATWDIEKAQAAFTVGDKTFMTGDYYLVTKLADGSYLPVSGGSQADSYRPLSNAEFREIAQEVLNAVPGSRLVTTGSVRDRRQVFYTIRLPENKGGKLEAGGHKFLSSFSLLNSFDGSIPIIGVASMTDTVCANTLGMNASQAMSEGENGTSVVARHTVNLDLDALKREFVASAEANYLFVETFEQLGNWKVDEEQATHFFSGFVADKRASLTSRSAGIVTRLTNLFQRGNGNRGESLRDVLSAVTDYYTHESAGSFDETKDSETEKNRVRWKQYLSSEFGTAAAVKADCFDRLNRIDRYAETVEVGADLWKAWLKNN